MVGYPIGGDSLAISAGVVSRVQMTHCECGAARSAGAAACSGCCLRRMPASLQLCCCHEVPCLEARAAARRAAPCRADSHGCMSLLAVQTDAAINSGNSGGPVMNARVRGRLLSWLARCLSGQRRWGASSACRLAPPRAPPLL